MTLDEVSEEDDVCNHRKLRARRVDALPGARHCLGKKKKKPDDLWHLGMTRKPSKAVRRRCRCLKLRIDLGFEETTADRWQQKDRDTLARQ